MDIKKIKKNGYIWVSWQSWEIWKIQEIIEVLESLETGRYCIAKKYGVI